MGVHLGLFLGGAEKKFGYIQTTIYNTATLKVHGEYKVVDVTTGTVLDDENYVVVENTSYVTGPADADQGDPRITVTWITGPNYVTMGFSTVTGDGHTLPCQSLVGYNGTIGPIDAAPYNNDAYPQWTMTFKPSCP